MNVRYKIGLLSLIFQNTLNWFANEDANITVKLTASTKTGPEGFSILFTSCIYYLTSLAMA